jgi:hypothetical protein
MSVLYKSVNPTIPESLRELLSRWKHRPPSTIHIDLNVDMFTESSWQYVLYGMGYKTYLKPKAGVFKYYAEAKAAFKEVNEIMMRLT